MPGISTEQLRSRLNRMVADGLLTRQRYREVPPRVDYELTDRARDLVPVLGALARWGYEWSWTEPRRNEAIDVGAIFRLAPGLLTLPRSLRGTVELTVTDRSKDGETKQYAVLVKRGVVTLEERAEPEADAQVLRNGTPMGRRTRARGRRERSRDPRRRASRDCSAGRPDTRFVAGDGRRVTLRELA